MTSKPKQPSNIEQEGQRILDFQRGMLVANLLSTDSNTAIQESLVQLQLISKASRVYIFENFVDPNDGLCIRQTNEACAPDVTPEIDNPDMQHLPYDAFAPHWPDILSAGERIGDVVANMSDAEREVFESQEILALLIIPIHVADEWYGFIGFDNTYVAEAWDNESVQLLQTAASLLGAHLARRKRQSEQSHTIAVSEARHQALIESLPDPIIVYNGIGEVQYLNPAFSTLFGWSLSELQGQQIDFVPEDRLGEMLKIGRDAVINGRTHQKETQRKSKAGQLIDVSLSVAVLRNTQDEYDGMIVTLHDITQEKKDQADLLAYRDHLEQLVDERAKEVKQSANTARALINAIPDLVFQFDKNGIFLDYKPSADSPLIMKPEMFLGKSAEDVLPPNLASLVKKGIKHTTETGKVHTDQYSVETNGETNTYEARFAIGGGNKDTVVLLSRNITAEIDTQETMNYQASILEDISDVIISSDLNFNLRSWNKAAERLYGYRAEDILGKPSADYIVTEYLDHPTEDVLKHVYTKGSYVGRARQKVANGREFIVRAVITLLRDTSGEPTGFAATNHDITQQVESENQLIYQANLLANVQDAIISTDKDLNIITWNKAAEKMYGYTATEVVGKRMRDIVKSEFPGKNRDDVIKTVFSTGSWEGSLEQVTQKGKRIIVNVSVVTLNDEDGNVTGIITTNRDVTALQETEAERQRLNSILESSTDYVAIADLNGDVIYQNKAGYDLLNIPVEDRSKKLNIMNLFSKESRRRLLGSILPALQNADTDTWLGETEAKTKDGRVLPMSQLIIAHRDSQGELEYISTVARDISAIKRVEADRARLNSIVENTSDLVALLDLEYNLVFLNNAGSELVGRSLDTDSETPLNLADLIPGHMVPIIFDQVLPHADTHGEWSGESYLQHQDSREIPVTQVLTAYRENDELSYYALVARDITLQQTLNQQTEQSLKLRSRQVELTTDLAQQIAAETELGEIYSRVVNLVNNEFGYYHTQLLQYNQSSSSVVLVVGHGEIGTKMLAEGHIIPVGIGLIGVAAITGETQLSPDLSRDENWLPNPNLPKAKGELSVPIKFQGQVFGILDVQSDEVNKLTEEDKVMLEGLCGQIAIAIENTRLRQNMERRLEELSRLQRLMIREGWEQYNTSTESENRGYIYDQDDVQPLNLDPNSKEQIANPLLSLSTTSTAPLIENPISVRGESVATIGIQDTPDQPLTDDEQALLREISQQVGEALENARLLEQTHKRAVELETVARVSSTTSTILQRDQLLQSVATLAKENFGLYHANVYVVEEDTDDLRLIAGSGGIGELLIAEEWRVQKHDAVLPAEVVRTGKGLISNDVYNDSSYIPNPFLPETRAKLAVPMIAGGSTMGVLELHSDRPNSFTNEDLQIHNTLATQTAIALQNAELFQEQLETAEKLREVDRLKSEFLASMSHELRTPLNSIIGFADVLLEGIDGELNDRMHEDVTLIRNGGEHLRNLIGDILDMSKIEAGMMTLSYGKVDLGRIAMESLAQIQGMIQEKPVHIIDNIEEDIGYIQADRTRLIQILLNILTNAAKFTDQGSITLTMKRQHNFDVIISVEDTGDGIKEDDIPLVFAQFRQVGDMQDRKAGGTGLGMPITKQLVELHGGQIWLESTHGVGTTFWFTLPHEPPNKEDNSTQGYYA